MLLVGSSSSFVSSKHFGATEHVGARLQQGSYDVHARALPCAPLANDFFSQVAKQVADWIMG